jgi:uncharacterized DUF497 family protein
MNDLIFWDEPKRLANLDNHGLDFADIERDFDFANAVLHTRTPRNRSHFDHQSSSSVEEGEEMIDA